MSIPFYLAIDIGNVLFDLDFEPIIGLIRECSYSPDYVTKIYREEAVCFLNRSQKICDAGLSSMHDQLEDLFIKYNIDNFLIPKVLGDWNKTMIPNEEIISELENLENIINDRCMTLMNGFMKADIKVALLSNIGFEHAEYIRKNIFPKYKLFNNAIQYFSCEVGARKPAFLYYQSFLQQYPMFNGAVYVDDLQDNLDSAKKFGFRPFRLSLSELKNNNGSIKEEVSKIKDLLMK